MVRIFSALMGPEGLQLISDPINYRFRAGMPANAFGTYSSIAILGLIVLAPRFWGVAKPRRVFVLRIVLWTLLSVIQFQGMVFSQSRSSMLSLAIVLPVIVAVLFWERWRKSDVKNRKLMVILLFVAIFVFAGLISLNRDILSNRMLTSSDSFEKIAEGNISGMSAPAISMGLRFYLWKFAWDHWKMHPLFGWGPGGARYLLDQIRDPNLLRYHPKGINNFHNSLVHLAIQLGITGLIFYTGFMVILFWGFWRAFRDGYLPLDISLAVMGAFFLFLSATLSNIRTNDHFGQNFVYLFGGIAYAYRMRLIWGADAVKAPH